MKYLKLAFIFVVAMPYTIFSEEKIEMLLQRVIACKQNDTTFKIKRKRCDNLNDSYQKMLAEMPPKQEIDILRTDEIEIKLDEIILLIN